jgi:hypothetical protein
MHCLGAGGAEATTDGSAGDGWGSGVEEERRPWPGRSARREPAPPAPGRERGAGRGRAPHGQELDEGGAQADRAVEQRAFRTFAGWDGGWRRRAGRVRAMRVPTRLRGDELRLDDDRQPAVQQQGGDCEPADETSRAPRTIRITPPSGAVMSAP